MSSKAYASCTWSSSEIEGGGDSGWSGDIEAELRGEGEVVRVNGAVKEAFTGIGAATVIIGWTYETRVINKNNADYETLSTVTFDEDGMRVQVRSVAKNGTVNKGAHDAFRSSEA